MKSATVIGARGFVGSAIVRALHARDIDVCEVTRENYASMVSSRESEVVIDASGNSTKYLADADPVAEFDRSVTHRLRTLRDFPAGLQVHVSSVDVYSDLGSPATTSEDSVIELGKTSHYGAHKLLAEELVRHYSDRWLIVRLAGMVGPGLRKNPVFDVMTGAPLRIHPDSQYQFASSDVVAEALLELIARGRERDVFNVCGSELITPRGIAAIAGREINLTALEADARPRIVNVNIEKIQRLIPMPGTRDAVTQFLARASSPPAYQTR